MKKTFLTENEVHIFSFSTKSYLYKILYCNLLNSIKSYLHEILYLLKFYQKLFAKKMIFEFLYETQNIHCMLSIRSVLPRTNPKPVLAKM